MESYTRIFVEMNRRDGQKSFSAKPKPVSELEYRNLRSVLKQGLTGPNGIAHLRGRDRS